MPNFSSRFSFKDLLHPPWGTSSQAPDQELHFSDRVSQPPTPVPSHILSKTLNIKVQSVIFRSKLYLLETGKDKSQELVKDKERIRQMKAFSGSKKAMLGKRPENAQNHKLESHKATERTVNPSFEEERRQ